MENSEIAEAWNAVEKGYYESNKKFIDKDGWMRTPFYKPTKKGKALLEQRGSSFRPKSLSERTTPQGSKQK